RAGARRTRARHVRNTSILSHRNAAGVVARAAGNREHVGQLFKETSLVSTLAVADLTYRALALRTENYRTLEVLTTLAVVYLVLAYPQAKFCDWLYRRQRVKE